MAPKIESEWTSRMAFEWKEGLQRAVMASLIAVRSQYIRIDREIPSAFILVDKYLSITEDLKYPLILVIAAAIFVAAKANENPMTIADSFKFACAGVLKIKSKISSEVFSNFGMEDAVVRNPTKNESEKVCKLEFDLLEVINYRTCISSPFVYVKRRAESFLNSLDPEEKLSVSNSINKACLDFILSRNKGGKTDEKAASEILEKFLPKKKIPSDLQEWIDQQASVISVPAAEGEAEKTQPF